ncbi:PRC-barrel domain containing protein [Rhodobacteraceae bacterium]|nr:PRC-barrel domain containing protein [Paracoccaceae bacterium]
MKFLTTTILSAALVGGAAYAQEADMKDQDAGKVEAPMKSDAQQGMDNMQADSGMDMSDPAKLIRTRDITGGDIYSVAEDGNMDWTGDWRVDSMEDGWRDNLTDIGDIEDIILSPEGQMIGVVAEVGGFLDIADKHVVLPVNVTKLVPIDDGEYAIVTNKSEEELEQLEDVDEGFWQ